MSAVDYCICIEELGSRRSFGLPVGGRAQRSRLCAHLHVRQRGAEAEVLVPLAAGEQLAAWALTEASSGSDAAAMRTTATRDGDGWV